MAVKYAEEVGSTESGYFLFSLIELGEINEKQGNKAEGKRYFTDVRKKAYRENEAFKDARRRLKELEKGN